MRIFISHSTRTKDDRVVLSRLTAGLRAKGYDVFIDREIHAGEPWRWRLYHELALCAGAVVLLTEDTLRNSKWVRRELDILLWRAAFDPELVIVPVILDRTGTQAIRQAGFNELTETQFLQAGAGELSPEQIAERVVARFPATRAPTPDTEMNKWFTNITLVLHKIGAPHPEQMIKAARALGVRAEDFGEVPLTRGYHFLAHQFLGHATDFSTIDAVEPLLYCGDRESLARLVGLIQPTWVDAGASRPLTRYAAGQGCVAVLNARDPMIAKQYYLRATCVSPLADSAEVPLAVGEDVVGELVDACERTVKRLLGADPDLDEWDDLPADWVRNGPRSAKGARLPRFLILDASQYQPHTVARAVAHVRERFRWLSVIVLVGRTAPTPEEMTRWGLTDATLLEPPLKPDAEAQARGVINELRNMIERVGSR
ncbi:toll/interleukin-1 receptor domain-containing protein [Actinoplanes subglobosus]|uniref:Toll/interleukin-1 receptor domain-containing protein n=1 Tax=Actinoplanes subglobosus TaxID=1547892 RepID=A0ABV8J9T0_9ACTN